VALIAVGPENAILPTVTSHPHDERRGEQCQEDNRELDSPVSEHSSPLLMSDPRPMKLVESSGKAAVSFLQRDPIGNVYPINAALRSHGRPVGLLAIGPNDETRGVLVDAALCASETVRDIFIVSSDNDVVRALFKAAQPRVVKKAKQGIYLPGSFLESKENGLGLSQFMRERTYRLDRQIPVPSNSPPVRDVTAEDLSTLTISPAFDPYLGNPLNLPQEGRFYGAAGGCPFLPPCGNNQKIKSRV
jgi:hypothetical protein